MATRAVEGSGGQSLPEQPGRASSTEGSPAPDLSPAWPQEDGTFAVCRCLEMPAEGALCGKCTVQALSPTAGSNASAALEALPFRHKLFRALRKPQMIIFLVMGFVMGVRSLLMAHTVLLASQTHAHCTAKGTYLTALASAPSYCSGQCTILQCTA
jgi:hypothetical protein